MSEAGNDVMTLRAEYRDLAAEWGEARDNPDQANRIFKAHHALYKRIRQSAAGRVAITGLLDDPVTAVRVLAATHSLAWEPDQAAQALEEIEQESSTYAVDAKWTLRSYRSGKLNLDWLSPASNIALPQKAQAPERRGSRRRQRRRPSRTARLPGVRSAILRAL